MTGIPFYKMSGCGNDFIIIDNRKGVVVMSDPARFAARVCRRRLSAGADGLILVENTPTADFKWRFFNSDGSAAEMCGNGARCAARFAQLLGIAGERMTFETLVGTISATVTGDLVKIKLTDPKDLVLDETVMLAAGPVSYGRVNTGVPHVVIEVPDVESVDVVALGREIRQHNQFAPAGTNVNFVAPLPVGLFAIRTYERGVEDETLACGTGNAAAALVLAERYRCSSPVKLQTRSGGILTIHFHSRHGRFEDLHLEGDARVVYEGVLQEEAWI
jgi:diaminopimelate epimerase